MATQVIQTTLHRLHSAGLRLTLTPYNGLKVSPASSMNDAMRALIVAHKVEIVAALSEAANGPASNAAALDPDRHCWPHSPTMNTAEIAAFATRPDQFAVKGLLRTESEILADKLVNRDREQDDRRVCMECSHLAGYGSGSWRCGNSRTAVIALRGFDAHLPTDLVAKLQRCDGFFDRLKGQREQESEVDDPD